MPLVTRQGFRPIEPIAYASVEADVAGITAIDFPNDGDPERVTPHLESLELIRIPFPKSDDGRGFSLAKRLRSIGFRGELRAYGHVISDQFRYALECGFDSVEIDDTLAARQPESHWRLGPVDSYRGKLSRLVASEPPTPANLFVQHVKEVEHYTDRLFRFRVTRPQSFRFQSGEFVMIGLPNATNPVFRAYSIASPAWDDNLEFYSIKVPDGPLTKDLQRIREGDRILLRKKATGTLTLGALTPAKRLWLLCTGTGIAPFASIVRDPQTYRIFEQVLLVHTCRTSAELVYGHQVVQRTMVDPLVGDESSLQLTHYASTTREPGERTGRITTLMESGELLDAVGVDALSPEHDRVMICGSMAMLKDLSAFCESLGLNEGTSSRPGDYAVERAFVG